MDNHSDTRVMGIDPGSRSCGYGVVESVGNGVRYVTSGTITPPASGSVAERLNDIYAGVLGVIDDYGPDAVSIEEMFFAKNARSAIKLGQSRGVAMLAAARRDVPVSEYAPTRVKLALTGKGRANKDEMQRMLGYMLGIGEFASADESDALAIAICHVNLSRYGLSADAVPRTGSRRRKKRFTANDISA